MYVAAILSRLGEKLDSRAAQTVVAYVIAGILLGAFAGWALSGIHRGPGLDESAIMAGFIIGGLLGAAVGEGKAFELRVRAQTILCLVAIEANTRRNGRVD